jgi:hypothetical protein
LILLDFAKNIAKAIAFSNVILLKFQNFKNKSEIRPQKLKSVFSSGCRGKHSFIKQNGSIAFAIEGREIHG